MSISGNLLKTVSVPIDEYQAFTAWRSSVVSEKFTTLEKKRHHKGLAEIKDGKFVTLIQLKNELANNYRQSSQKKSGKVTKR